MINENEMEGLVNHDSTLISVTNLCRILVLIIEQNVLKQWVITSAYISDFLVLALPNKNY